MRDWEIPNVPCEGFPCTSLKPSCGPCLAGLEAFMADGYLPHHWHEILTEFGRESWRREAADA